MRDISARELKGHNILAVERFWDNTRWMIEFSVLRPSTAYGSPGEEMRLFLTEDGYQAALQSQQRREIKIKRYARVIEGHILDMDYYVAECMEFPNLGEYHDNLSLEEAIRIYQEIPAERMNGIKGIGFELKDGSDYEGPFPILTGQTIDLDTIQAIDYYRDNPLVQKAVKELAAAMPEMEVLGADANQQEALFLIDNATYLHIQSCDSGWDYTLYDAASMKELDGGQLDMPEISRMKAVLQICDDNDLGRDSVKYAPLSMIETLQEAAYQQMQAEVSQMAASSQLPEAQEQTLDEYPMPDEQVSTPDMRRCDNMNTNDLNTALYEKMAAEQDKFRDWLKSQPPEEVLNHAYEYTIREDIVMAMEELELTDTQAQALLESPSPLADVYRYFEKLETGYMDVIRDSIESRADDVCRAKEELRTTPVYPHSAAYASEHGEMAQYNLSYQANSACKEAIEQTISAHYAENRLDTEAAVKDVLEKFGTERVQFILANTIQRKNYDGRISQDNKAWAKNIPTLEDSGASRHCAYLVVDQVNPGLTDLFTRQFRKVAQEQQKSSVLQKLKQELPAHKSAAPKKREPER